MKGKLYRPKLPGKDRVPFRLPEKKVPGDPKEAHDQTGQQRALTRLQPGQSKPAPTGLFACGVKKEELVEELDRDQAGQRQSPF